MNYLGWMERAVGERLPEIGQPVFARLCLELTADHGRLAGLAKSGLETVGRWMASGVRSVHEAGGARQGFVSLLAEFANGQTALVSAESAHQEPSVQVLIVGRHGTLRWDDFPQPSQLSE